MRATYSPERIARTGALAACLFATGAACDDAQPQIHERADCDPVPQPRWVLRDKNGDQVRALVEPRCAMIVDYNTYQECIPLDFGSSRGFPCVRIIDHEDRYINLEYHLATGKIGPCQGGEYADIKKHWGKLPTYLTDETCAGAQYIDFTGGKGYHDPEFSAARSLIGAEGEFWYPGEDGCLPDTTVAWYIAGDNDDECLEHVPPLALCPLKAIPQWISDLLPNPPYTLAVEYD